MLQLSNNVNNENQRVCEKIYGLLEVGLIGSDTKSSTAVSISIFENEVPTFVAPEMERLYSNIFSTLSQLSFKQATSLNTYVAWQGMKKTAVFLFEQKEPVIYLLNEGIRINENELLQFSHAVFSKYPSAKIIRFHAIDCDIKNCSLPFQQHPVLEDIVLALPDTPERYLASLGKSTRSYLNRYLNKIRRECPTFQHQVFIGEEIEESLIRELIDMHKARMTSKDKLSVIDDKRVREIMHLAKEFGIVVVLRVDGRICAGTINYRVGDNYFLETVAHDSAYSEYRIGTLCSYLTVCECINRSGKEYHFLWGEYDYKYRLGGVQRKLKDLSLYRSRTHMLLCSNFALKIAARHYLLQLKKRLLHRVDQQGKFGSRIAGVMLRLLKNGRNMITNGRR